MSTPPVIGVTCAAQPVNDRPASCLNTTYVQAVLLAGGVPVILPTDLPPETVPLCLARLDGLILSGGGDVDPARFGEAPHPRLGAVDPRRDAWELAAARCAFEKGLPTLGICRGEQVMAVAVGSTLWQDIPSQLPQSGTHRYPGDTQPHECHRITVAEGTRLAAIMGSGSHPVNTFHHQAVKQPAGSLTICARAADGVIEAVEAADRFFLGVQWHPERLVTRDEKALALFRALIRAAETPV